MKRYLIIVVSLVALASCAKYEPALTISDAENNEIVFSSYTVRPVTKAGESAFSQSFSVEAFTSEIPSGIKTRAIFFNPTIYNYVNGKYYGASIREWPESGNLDFYAASPLAYKNTSGAAVDLKPAADSTITVIKTDGTTDIVASRAVNVANGTKPVELVFGHKLTKIAFKAVGDDKSKKYVITDLVLTANSTALYSYPKAATIPVAEKWGAGTDPYGYDYVSSDVEIAEDVTAPVNVGTARYLIPAQAENVTLTVKYKIVDGTTIVDDNTAGVSVSLPVSGVWGINKSVVYTLTLGYSTSAKVIRFSASEGDWEDDSAVNANVPAQYIENGINFGPGTKVGNVVWAPVNCGTDTSSAHPYLYGKLYQWGRKYPCEYNGGWTDGNGTHAAESVLQTTANLSAPISANLEKSYLFYVVPAEYYFMWLAPIDTTRWNNAAYPNSAGQLRNVSPIKTANDPCPDGWRVPTYSELEDLIGGNTRDSFQVGTGLFSGMSGIYLNGTPSADSGVFLPAAGSRDFFGNPGEAAYTYRGNLCMYWTSSVDEDGEGWGLIFYDGFEAGMTDSYTSYAFSIRCVAE